MAVQQVPRTPISFLSNTGVTDIYCRTQLFLCRCWRPKLRPWRLHKSRILPTEPYLSSASLVITLFPLWNLKWYEEEIWSEQKSKNIFRNDYHTTYGIKFESQSLKSQEKNSCACCYTYNKVNQTEICSLHSVSFVGGWKIKWAEGKDLTKD